MRDQNYAIKNWRPKLQFGQNRKTKIAFEPNNLYQLLFSMSTIHLVTFKHIDINNNVKNIEVITFNANDTYLTLSDTKHVFDHKYQYNIKSKQNNKYIPSKKKKYIPAKAC